MKKNHQCHRHSKKSLRKSLPLKVLKVISCHFISLVLLGTQATYAQLDLVTGAVQSVTAIMQQKQQQEAAAAAAEHTAAMMAQFSPQNQIVPSKYFPACPVIKARTDFPSGVCEGPPQVNDGSGVQTLMSVRDLLLILIINLVIF